MSVFPLRLFLLPKRIQCRSISRSLCQTKPEPSQTSAKAPTSPAASTAPGEGIRSLQTSNVFRAVNFELYARPNRYMIGFGLFAFTLSLIYLIAWKVMGVDEKKNLYTAMDDNDELVVRQKRSKWD